MVAIVIPQLAYRHTNTHSNRDKTHGHAHMRYKHVETHAGTHACMCIGICTDKHKRTYRHTYIQKYTHNIHIQRRSDIQISNTKILKCIIRFDQNCFSSITYEGYTTIQNIFDIYVKLNI